MGCKSGFMMCELEKKKKVNIKTSSGIQEHAVTVFFLFFLRCGVLANGVSLSSAFWIDFCLFPIQSERAIFSGLVAAESHSVRWCCRQIAYPSRSRQTQTGCWCCCLNLSRSGPWSSNLPLSPVIYRRHCICLPLPLPAEFLNQSGAWLPGQS